MPTFRKSLIWSILGAGALLAAGLGIVTPFVFEPNHFAGVRSIEGRPDFRDPRLMAAASRLPVATSYPQQSYEFQVNPSFCGPTSLADVLHSVGDRRSQAEVLAGTPYDPWFGVLLGGLTLDQLADLARLKVGPTAVYRDATLAAFRAHLRDANSPSARYIVNFHRGPLFGRGHGHFSPVLAYMPERDLVLVGDVNAEYRPFLVPSAKLWTATRIVDDATGRPRGLLRIAMRRSTTTATRASSSLDSPGHHALAGLATR